MRKEYQLDDGSAILLQIIPTFLSLAVMSLAPFYAQKSLKIYRAVQAYGSQPLGWQDYSEYENRSFWRKHQFTLSYMISQIVNAIVIHPSNTEHLDRDWSTFCAFRNSIPFVLLTLAIYVGLLQFFSQFIFEEMRVTGIPHNESNENGEYSYITSAFSYVDRQKTYMYLRISCAFSAFGLTYLCTFLRKDSDTNVIAIALSSMIHAYNVLGNNFVFFGKASLRLHMRRIVVLIIVTTVLLSLLVGVLWAFFSSMAFFFKSEKSAEKNTAAQEEDIASSNVVMMQMVCFFQVFLWPIPLFFSARLLTLAYRYDASKQGLTSLTDHAKRQAISESRQMTLPAKPIKNARHNLDCLGRTPVDVNTKALRIKDAVEYTLFGISQPFPIFSIALKAVVGFHLLFVLFTCLFIPPDFNIPFFDRSRDQLSCWDSHFISVNITGIASYFALLAAIPAAAASNAARKGQSVRSGLRDLWQYEEDWNVSYGDNPPSSSQMETGDQNTCENNDDEDDAEAEVKQLLVREKKDSGHQAQLPA